MTKRPYVGELGSIPQMGLTFTLRAEAMSPTILDVLVQLRAFVDGGYQVLEVGKFSIPDKSFYIGPDLEEATETFLQRAFGM